MKLYKDICNDDELLSDAYPIKEDGACYVVEGKYVTRTAGSIGFGGADGTEDSDEADLPGVTVLNVADAHSLVETSYDKKNYTDHIRAYLKRIAEALPADERAARHQQAAEWAEQVINGLDSYQFFTGASRDPEAMVVLVKMGEDGKTPFLYYIRHGLKIEEH